MTSPTPDAGCRGPTYPLVLIVDDNELNLKLARDVLRAAGFRTIEATTGEQAVALAGGQLPDVVLMDLRLPDMGGADATRKLQDGERTEGIPVVALSSLPLDGNCDWLRAAGFAGYLEKPFSISEFPAQVRSYCTCARP